MGVPYRPPTYAPPTPWSRYLHDQLRRRDWSYTRAFEELREGLGLAPKSRTAFTDWVLNGKRPPSPREAEFLRSYFGGGPEDLPEVKEAPPVDPVAAAIDRQTKAIEAQTAAFNDLAGALRQLATATIGGQDALRNELLKVLGAANPIVPGHGGVGDQEADPQRPARGGAAQ